jgi:BlaI family transcriptional regulator, penicillinase repressor
MLDQQSLAGLSRRERQIMDIVYQRGRVSAAEVLAALPNPPTYSTVRALLRILEEKGHLQHQEQGLKYVFLPVRPRDHAGRQAMQRVVHTFYDGSLEKAVAALLEVSDSKLSAVQMKRLQALIHEASQEGEPS